MKVLPVYCQLSFYISFLQNRPKADGDAIWESDEEKKWKLFSEIIHRNSEVYIDASYEQLKENSQYAKFLVKAHNDGRIVLKSFKMEQLDDHFFNTVNPHSIFLCADKEKCKEMQEDYGMLFISEKDIYDCPVTKKYDEELSSLNMIYGGWGILNKFKHPCNAMVIADNYILDNFQLLENNLLQIIKKMLPDKLRKRDFHITIITNCQDNGRLKYDIKSRYRHLIHEISGFKRANKISYAIVIKIIGIPGYSSDKIHDRNIVTNYIRIYSGKGFSISQNAQFHTNARFSVDFITNDKVFDHINNLIGLYRIADMEVKDFVIFEKEVRNRLLEQSPMPEQQKK